MMSLLNYTFEEAFLKLKLHNRGNNKFEIEITDIRIEYWVDFQEMMYVPATFADVYRRIFYKNKLEPSSDVKLHADEESIFNLGIERNVEKLEEISEDLKDICPHIEALFELMEQGY